jgi:hypothetical protein
MKRNQKLFVGVLVTLATLLSIGVATQVSARDMKSYHPSTCVADDDGASNIHRTQTATYSTSPGVVYCPAVKDQYGSDYGQIGGMRVYDGSSTGDLSCTLYLRTQNGTSADWDSDSTSGTPGYDTLNFSVVTGANSSTASYVYYCHFGYGSSNLTIRSYWLSEYNSYD